MNDHIFRKTVIKWNILYSATEKCRKKNSLIDTFKYGFGVTCTYIRIFEIPIIILNVSTTRT